MIYGFGPDHKNKVTAFTQSKGGIMLGDQRTIPDNATGIVLTGFSHGLNEPMKEGFERDDLNIYHIDNGYFKKTNKFTDRVCADVKRFFRITKNCWIPSKIVERDSARRPAGINMRPWRGCVGEYILALPTDPRLDYILNENKWLENKLRDIDLDLPIKYRDRDANTTLEEDFKRAACVVSHSSMVLVEAMLYGITTFTSKHGHTYEIDGQVEEPNRWRVIDHLCYTQFSYDEIVSGYAAEMVDKTYG